MFVVHQQIKDLTEANQRKNGPTIASLAATAHYYVYETCDSLKQTLHGQC